jgi:phage shock protein A
MSIFKRLSATVFSQVDKVVSEIENHDAIVEAAIRDNQRALAKAKVRFNRLRADGQRLQRRLEDLKTAEARWIRRAKEQADQDEQTALQCLQKRRECQKQMENVENALGDHHNAESRLSRELATMEERIKQIQHQKNLLRTRQSTADAMRTFKAIEDCSYIDIDDTFEKWEVKVMETELASGDVESVDSLEQRFVDAEELEDLQSELKELTEGDER